MRLRLLRGSERRAILTRDGRVASYIINSRKETRGWPIKARSPSVRFRRYDVTPPRPSRCIRSRSAWKPPRYPPPSNTARSLCLHREIKPGLCVSHVSRSSRGIEDGERERERRARYFSSAIKIPASAVNLERDIFPRRRSYASRSLLLSAIRRRYIPDCLASRRYFRAAASGPAFQVARVVRRTLGNCRGDVPLREESSATVRAVHRDSHVNCIFHLRARVTPATRGFSRMTGGPGKLLYFVRPLFPEPSVRVLRPAIGIIVISGGKRGGSSLHNS